jgi:hypothetical protein
MGIEAIKYLKQPQLRVCSNVFVDVMDTLDNRWCHLFPSFHHHKGIFNHLDGGAQSTTKLFQENISVPSFYVLPLQHKYCWTLVTRYTDRSIVCGLLLVLVSVSTSNHFHTTVILTCHHVCFIATNNKLIDELTTCFATKKEGIGIGIATTELIECAITRLMPPLLLFDYRVAAFFSGMLLNDGFGLDKCCAKFDQGRSKSDHESIQD